MSFLRQLVIYAVRSIYQGLCKRMPTPGRPNKDLEDRVIVGAVIELFEMIGAHIAF